MSMSYTLDIKEFEERFNDLIKKSIDIDVVKGYRAVGNAIINASNKEIPKSPHRSGDLRASGKVEVEVDGIAFGFNVPYAAKWHETTDTINWSERGVGPKYMSKKMYGSGDKWLEIFGEFLKNRLKK